MPATLNTRHARFTVRHPSLLPRVLRLVRSLDAVVERRECGANAEGGGGFQPGNTCGKGDGGGGGSSGGSKKSGRVHDSTGLPMNDDGTVTVYHHTSASNAEKIKATGKLKSAGEPHVYVTTQPDANTGYGDTVVAIKVNPDDLELDDEFPGGRKDFKISVDRPGGEVKVALDDGEGKDKGGEPAGEASKAVRAWAQKAFSNPRHAENFVRWFGDSKVVGDNGEPLLVHKGMPRKDWKTGKDIDAVQSTNGPWAGFFSDDKAVADRFAQAFKFSGDTQTLSGYAVIRNPHVIDAGGKPAKSVQFDQVVDGPSGPKVQVAPRIKEIADSGRFDGIIIKNTSDEGTVFVPFNPEGVKSSDNSGAFDPKSKNYKRSESRECGANAEGGGGFQPGNTCGKGDGGGVAASSGGDGGGSGGGGVEPAKAGDGPLVKAARDEHKKALDKLRKNLDKAQEKADAKFAETTKKFYEAKDAHFDASDRAAKLQEEHAGIIQRLSEDPTNATLQQALERSTGMLEESSKEFESTHKAMEKLHKQREKVRQEMRSAVQKALRKECDSVNKEDGVEERRREQVQHIYGLESHVGAAQFGDVAERSRVIASRAVVQQEMKEAQDFAMNAVNPEIHVQAMTTPIVFEESVRASATVREIDHDAEQLVGYATSLGNRSSYTTLSANDNASTHVHEMAHHMEYSTPEVRELTNDFLASRTGGESPVQFSKKFPDVGYADDEVGSPDDFSKAFKAAGYSDEHAERLAHYAGKRYDGTMTEVLTMGMELMYKDARAFAASDPEWFDLVFGVASGRILSKTRKARKEQRPYVTPS